MLTGAMGVCSNAAGVVGRVIRGGLRLRGTSPIQSAEQLLCNSSRPVSAFTSPSSLTAKPTADVENVLIMEAGEPVPRLVFGSAPSFQEAKEATGELKEVFDAIYLSSPQSFESETSLIPEIFMPLNSGMNSEIVENISGVTMENNISNPRLKHVHQAFCMLRHSLEIQNIVASVASDQRVYEAVVENPEVQKFMQANRTSSATLEDEEEGESEAGVKGKFSNLKDFVIKMVSNVPFYLPGFFGSSGKENASGSDQKADKSGSSFMEKLRNLKRSVVENATKIPNYIPNFYGSSAAESASGSDDKGNTQSSTPEFNFGTSITGLAIMVIMLVVFKRVYIIV